MNRVVGLLVIRYAEYTWIGEEASAAPRFQREIFGEGQ